MQRSIGVQNLLLQQKELAKIEKRVCVEEVILHVNWIMAETSIHVICNWVESIFNLFIMEREDDGHNAYRNPVSTLQIALDFYYSSQFAQRLAKP